MNRFCRGFDFGQSRFETQRLKQRKPLPCPFPLPFQFPAPGPPRQALPVGSWSIEYSNGFTHVMTVNECGEAWSSRLPGVSLLATAEDRDPQLAGWFVIDFWFCEPSHMEFLHVDQSGCLQLHHLIKDPASAPAPATPQDQHQGPGQLFSGVERFAGRGVLLPVEVPEVVSLWPEAPLRPGARTEGAPRQGDPLS